MSRSSRAQSPATEHFATPGVQSKAAAAGGSRHADAARYASREQYTLDADHDEYDDMYEDGDDNDDDEDGEGERSFFVRALYSFQSSDASSLSFNKGDLIEVLTQLESGWWDGLLGAEVRGWFPSNYVERISDDEAEALLQAREVVQSQVPLSGSSAIEGHYAGLGLGHDFDALRQLMGDAHHQDGSDAFHQLAEAAMGDSRDNPLEGRPDDLLSTSRSSRTKENSNFVDTSLATQSDGNSFRSQTDLSSMPSRSAAASFSETSGTTGTSTSAATSAMQSLKVSDIPERERSRAYTVSVGDGTSQKAMTGRPRALTASMEPRGTGGAITRVSSDQQAAVRSGAGAVQRPSARLPTRDSSDFWVPKVNDRGDIVYFNTKTGAISRDMPEGVSSSEEMDTQDGQQNDGDASYRKASVGFPQETRPGTSQSNQARHIQSRHTSSSSAQHTPNLLLSRLSGASSTTSRGNNVEYMPDPREVPWPWVIQTSDDETTFHFFNQQTLQMTNDKEEVTGRGNASVSSRSLFDSPPRLGRGSLTGRDGQAIGTSMQARHGRQFDGELKHLAAYKFSDEQEAWRLQQAVLNDSAANSLRHMLDDAKTHVAALATVVLEPLGPDGLSEEDAKALPTQGNSLQDSSRLGALTKTVVRCIRDALHAVGAFGVSDLDLVATTELLRLLDDEASTVETFKSLRGAIVALQTKDLHAAPYQVQPHVAVALAQADPSPLPSLISIGRRVSAIASKLVLSARSVVEHSHLNVQARPALSQAQLEKITSYRQRIRDDSMELARLLNHFQQEIERVRPDALDDTASLYRARPGMLQSAAGSAGIGLNILGGGAAAGWRGNGFVLPSAIEAVALQAEAQGLYSSPMDLGSDIRDALSSGKISLRRKPHEIMTREMIESRVSQAADELQVALKDTFALLQANTVEQSRDSSDIQPLESRETLEQQVRQSLTEVGAYLTLIENLDLASALDVDGPSTEANQSAAGMTRYLESVLQTRRVLHRFASAKQGLYDAGNEFLMHTQDLIALPPAAYDSSLSSEDIANDSLHAVEKMQSLVRELDSILRELVDLHELQGKEPFNAVGSRSKVYGVDDVQLHSVDTARADSGGQAQLAASGVSRGEQMSSASSMKAMRVLGSNASSNNPLESESAAGNAGLGLQGPSTAKAPEVTHAFLLPDTPPDDIVVSETGQVKGATLPGLMERLTMHNAYEPTFNSTFLLTYQSFTTTDELLDHLFARFRVEEPDGLTSEEHAFWVEKKQRPIQLRVFNILKSWIESYYHDGEHESQLQRIKDFALDEMAHSAFMSSPANLLLRSIERRSGKGEQMKITMVMPSSAPPPLLPKNLKKIKFLDIDPLEMARQLTLMDSRLYNRIRPNECLNKSWSRDNGTEIAKGIRDVISANNRVSGWVSEAILVQEDLKKRAGWVKHFVAIADRCFYLNNFSSMMAIYSGLNNASLNRLRRTWDAVNQRHLQLFDNMRAILAPTKNFSKYRETLRKLQPPCVPFLGVYLTDLTFIEDGNADRLRADDRLINFGKRQMTAEKIQEIVIYQSTPYVFLGIVVRVFQVMEHVNSENAHRVNLPGLSLFAPITDTILRPLPVSKSLSRRTSLMLVATTSYSSKACGSSHANARTKRLHACCRRAASSRLTTSRNGRSVFLLGDCSLHHHLYQPRTLLFTILPLPLPILSAHFLPIPSSFLSFLPKHLARVHDKHILTRYPCLVHTHISRMSISSQSSHSVMPWGAASTLAQCNDTHTSRAM